MATVTTLMQIQQSVLRRWYGLARACHCPQGGPDVRLHRESHRETQRDHVLGGEIEGREALGKSRKEGFLIEMGHSEELGSVKGMKAEGE